MSESDHRDVATDAELIGWSLAGDHEAFAEVACRHQQAVWAYLVRRAGRGSAEDLLGEVWTGLGLVVTPERAHLERPSRGRCPVVLVS